jgi:hypothetical protein
MPGLNFMAAVQPPPSAALKLSEHLCQTCRTHGAFDVESSLTAYATHPVETEARAKVPLPLPRASHETERATTRRVALYATAALAVHTELEAHPSHTREHQPHSALIEALQLTGGVLGTSFLVDVLRRRVEQPISMLARWIVGRQLLAFSWCGENLIPMFQLDSAYAGPLPVIHQVVTELGEVFDDIELLTWFAEPNMWLGERRPAELVVSDPAAVLDAARADRFVAVGA